MKLIAQLFAATALLACLNNAFAADGRKEAVLDMGKGAFTLTVSVPGDVEGPYDFAKNPGFGSKMTGQFQHQEVAYIAKVDDSSFVSYKATAQKISTNKKGQKLTAEHMAQDQIKDNGFKDRAVQINCPPVNFEGATSVCYKMSGDAIFENQPLPYKYAAVLISVSWANDTQGYTFMGKIEERNVEKFNSQQSITEKNASRALTTLWKNHKVTKN